MEVDRYKINRPLYIVGLLSLLVAMVLLGFCVYIFPNLFLGWVYDVPEFILSWQSDLIRLYGITPLFAAWNVFLIFLIPGLIAAVVATMTSNRIENTVQHLQTPTDDEHFRAKREARQTINILAKILMIVILVIIVVEIIEWVIFIPPPSTPPTILPQ